MKAVKLVERHARLTRALLAEFRRLVDALAERLTPGGRRKPLRADTLNGLRELCEQVAAAGAAWAELGQGAGAAREALSDWQAHELRNLALARQEVASGLARVAAELARLIDPHPV
jgi:hypothetical protein